MEKGQTSLELIFLILIIVIYIYTATFPLITNGQGAIEDIENVSKSNYETNRILQSVNKLAMLGEGSRETFTINLPNNSVIICDSNKIGFSSIINLTGSNPPVGLCSNNICDKNYSINTINFYCLTSSFSGKQEIVLSKTETSVVLSGED